MDFPCIPQETGKRPTRAWTVTSPIWLVISLPAMPLDGVVLTPAATDHALLPDGGGDGEYSLHRFLGRPMRTAGMKASAPARHIVWKSAR